MDSRLVPVILRLCFGGALWLLAALPAADTWAIFMLAGFTVAVSEAYGRNKVVNSGLGSAPSLSWVGG